VDLYVKCYFYSQPHDHQSREPHAKAEDVDDNFEKAKQGEVIHINPDNFLSTNSRSKRQTEMDVRAGKPD
jgi:hypothetical protein